MGPNGFAMTTTVANDPDNDPVRAVAASLRFKPATTAPVGAIMLAASPHGIELASCASARSIFGRGVIGE
jgi:hypothetical protein